MLLLIAVLAFLSAAFLLFRFTRRHDPGFSAQNTIPLEPPLNARPLFAPSEDELRREETRTLARKIARREYRAKAAARATIDEALSNWRSVSDLKNTSELLRVSAEAGQIGDFSRAANEIIEVFRKSGIDGLTRGDLAALLDSHYRLLPSGEQASGELFWLREEIAKLAQVNV
ncbi:MAG: hypothetical protein WBD16_10030 [Pyrinomonadaceae bacterium]